MQGWISVHRQIQNHWLWEEKPFSRGQAWIDLLMRVNHEDKKIAKGNEIVNVNAGSFITSDEKLGEAWGWSRHRVRNFLDLLQADNMISVTRTTKGTTVFVINYAKYRYRPTTEGQRWDSVGTALGQRWDTNNNDNNANNENKEELSYSLSCDRAVILWAKLMSEKIYVPLQNVRDTLKDHSEEETLKIFEEVEN